MASRRRIDERLVADGLVPSRSVAQRLIMAGVVRANGERIDKSSHLVSDAVQLSIDEPPRFVSRGGDKLDNALCDLQDELAAAGRDVAGSRAIDIGASTGGFTDCLLQRGASSVIAVDVGYGQLDSRLRNDPRIHNLERTNARWLQPEDLPWKPQIIVCDASFIPLRTILPGPLACMEPGFWGVILCKPQFEAGRQRLARSGTKGVLRDPEVRDEVVNEVRRDLERMELAVVAIVEARPRGAKGNVEYAMLIEDAAAGIRAPGVAEDDPE